MQVDSSVPIRFLLFPRGEEMTRSFSEDTPIHMIKRNLMQDWPKSKRLLNYIPPCESKAFSTHRTKESVNFHFECS